MRSSERGETWCFLKLSSQSVRLVGALSNKAGALITEEEEKLLLTHRDLLLPAAVARRDENTAELDVLGAKINAHLPEVRKVMERELGRKKLWEHNDHTGAFQ